MVVLKMIGFSIGAAAILGPALYGVVRGIGWLQAKATAPEKAQQPISIAKM